MSKFEDDVALVKNFIQTKSFILKISLESPLVEDLEKEKINKFLKVPPIELFDGSTDPSDFINLFDGRMDFSVIQRSRDFISFPHV